MCHIILLSISTISFHVTTTLPSNTSKKNIYVLPSPEKCHPGDTQIPHEPQGCDFQSFVDLPRLYTLNHE